MFPISVVIITKNEAHCIQDCIASARKVSNDIIVVDSGSADDTIALARQAGATIITTEWVNYSTSRNIGANAALHHWVLALDADERLSKSLVQSIRKLVPPSRLYVYGFKRENFFSGKKIRFGDWGNDVVYRLYNRKVTEWNLVPVHEKLLIHTDMQTLLLDGKLTHFTVKDMDEYKEKTVRYAMLSAYKYQQLQRKPNLVKRGGAPIVNFFICYVCKLGFLDGKEGLLIALHTAYYTWLKYHYFHKLTANSY